jgi:hypothetical protein
MEGCGNRASCRSLFKKFQILPLKFQYMLSLLIFVVQNKTLFFLSNTENYNLDTRQKKDNLYLPQANLTIYQKGAYYSGIKIFNNLPLEIKNFADNEKKFKTALKKNYVLIHFTPWKSTLVNYELWTVLQKFLI